MKQQRKHSEETGKQRSIPGGRKKRRRKSVESHASQRESPVRVKRSVRHAERRDLDVAADKY